MRRSSPRLSHSFPRSRKHSPRCSTPSRRDRRPASLRGPRRVERARPRRPDDLIERVTHDVLQRLSDRVVKETVADIVSSVAERMVRDEIDRIKANIRA